MITVDCTMVPPRECTPVVLSLGNDLGVPGDKGVVMARDDRPEDKRHGEWVVAPNDEWSEMADYCEMAMSCQDEDLAINLEHETGRVHVVWWIQSVTHPVVDLDIQNAIAYWMSPTVYPDERLEFWYQIKALNIPGLADLDMDNQFVLADGSRVVDAEALQIIAEYVYTSRSGA